MRRLAIIPARGGSKRIPNKNVREFCGKPMMAHILAAAQASGLFDVVHVSTDSEDIANVAARFGFPPGFMRPQELADDHTPIMPVLKYVANEYVARGKAFDQVWLLMACAPMIDEHDLQQADALFLSNGGADPLLGVSEYPAPVEWAFDRLEDGRLDPVSPGMFAVRSQDLRAKYFDAGAFAVFPARMILEAKGAGSDDNFVGYVIPRYKAIDIDSPEDWTLAEAVFRGMLRTEGD